MMSNIQLRFYGFSLTSRRDSDPRVLTFLSEQRYSGLFYG